MTTKNKKLVDKSGKIIGSESDLTNHGFTLNNSLDILVKQYLQMVKNQTDVNEFESLKFNYFKLFPKKMNKKSCLEFTDLVVHNKKTKIFDEDLKKIVISPQFWIYIKKIKERLNTGLAINNLRKDILQQLTNQELKTIILKEFLEVALDSLLTNELELHNLLTEALELGTTDQEIHEIILEKIWKDPTIKECYQIGSTEKTIIEKYQN